MKLPPLTNKAIKAFVEALPPDEPCAFPNDPQRCIVAQYIATDLNEYPHWRVTVGVSRIDVTAWDENWRVTDTARITPPPALVRLIGRFDALPYRPVLPAEVLPIFDTVQP